MWMWKQLLNRSDGNNCNVTDDNELTITIRSDNSYNNNANTSNGYDKENGENDHSDDKDDDNQ